MEKNISLTAKQSFVMNIILVVSHITSVLHSFADMCVSKIAAYYSDCLDHEINTRQAWLLLNAQAAFAMAFFPVSCPFMLRLLFIAWLIHALRLCKNEL